MVVATQLARWSGFLNLCNVEIINGGGGTYLNGVGRLIYCAIAIGEIHDVTRKFTF
jgi:hypothetical protein